MKSIEDYATVSREEIDRQVDVAKRKWAAEKAADPAKGKRYGEKHLPPTIKVGEMIYAGNMALIIDVMEDMQSIASKHGAEAVFLEISSLIENLE